MKDNTQIVLFFSNNSTFNPTKIADKIIEEIPSLKQPMILPPNKEDIGAPVIIFNQNKEINITVSIVNIALIFYTDKLKDCKKIILKLLDIFDRDGVSFNRIGYISSNVLPKKEVKKLKNRIFKDEELINAEDFQVAWYKKVLLDGTKVNCWERYFTDVASNDNLMAVYDINTPVQEEYNINDEFVSLYIKNCQSFIDDKIDN